MPVFEVAHLDPEVFAAFTGPEGGLTSICNLGEKYTANLMQVCSEKGIRQQSVKKHFGRGRANKKLITFQDKIDEICKRFSRIR